MNLWILGSPGGPNPPVMEDLQPRTTWLPVEEKAVTKHMHKAASMLSCLVTKAKEQNGAKIYLQNGGDILYPTLSV